MIPVTKSFLPPIEEYTAQIQRAFNNGWLTNRGELVLELEEKLRNMFKEIQVPFLKHSPLIRKNFLSYSYVIHKFIQLLEKDEYLKYLIAQG